MQPPGYHQNGLSSTRALRKQVVKKNKLKRKNKKKYIDLRKC